MSQLPPSPSSWDGVGELVGEKLGIYGKKGVSSEYFSS